MIKKIIIYALVCGIVAIIFGEIGHNISDHYANEDAYFIATIITSLYFICMRIVEVLLKIK